MGDKIIDCQNIAKIKLDALKNQKVAFAREHNRSPSLSMIQFRSHKSTQIYVKKIQTLCQRCDFDFSSVILEDSISALELANTIKALDQKRIDGIFVSNPFPKHISTFDIMNALPLNKDIDCCHPFNVGLIPFNQNALKPCTVSAVLEILKTVPIELKGCHAVIVGASTLVGIPMALSLIQLGCTTSICDINTRSLKDYTANADLLICAAGQPLLIHDDLVKSDSVIIDIGINPLPNGTIVGDVDLDSVIDKVRFITPVPNGVGVITQAILLENTLKSAIGK